jgi:hypothetical protein
VELEVKANTKSLAILENELPWITPFLPEKIQEFNVRIMDLDILGLRPEGSMSGEWCSYDRIYLVDETGRTITQMGVKTESVSELQFVWFPPFIWKVRQLKKVEFNESVEEAVKRTDAWNTRYVVRIFLSSSVTIYRLPRQVENLWVWLDQKAIEASKKIKETLES